MKRNRKKAKTAHAKRARSVMWSKPSSRSRNTALLVDGDIIIHQTIDQCLEEVRNEHDEWTYRVSLKTVKDMIVVRLKDHARELQASEIIMCVGSKNNWRKRVMPEYKANRKGTRKPLGYFSIVDWILDRGDHEYKFPFLSKRSPSLEADDVIGICATSSDFLPKYDKIVVSEDKDFQSIPCNLFNPRKPELGTTTISRENADEFHMLQTLMGDPTDGYHGVPGVGAVTAQKILLGTDKTLHDMWQAVVSAYEKAGMSKSDALLNARVARILRADDLNSDGSVKLWSPPKRK